MPDEHPYIVQMLFSLEPIPKGPSMAIKGIFCSRSSLATRVEDKLGRGYTERSIIVPFACRTQKVSRVTALTLRMRKSIVTWATTR